MSEFQKILFKYWGYEKFRSMQEEIIQSVASGKDTLGLLPTGGGKSITFQVPAMSKEGICLVISPLIALMKDQVGHLREKGVKADALYSGLSSHEIRIILNRCIYGDVKFLYVSPERLGTEAFLRIVPQLPISILAVDEAHCISQWGYDFRPSYLNIATLRETLPNVPVLALTATATPDVVKDIQEKLHFSSQNVFQKSFYRANLVYVVRRVDDKSRYLLKVLTRVSGSAVIYVRTRRRTREVADFLKQNGISAESYHAGLSHNLKDFRQKEWMNNKVRVMVATNAFGMGIDKADVRVVLHMDLPDTIEAYFQEAGRAGRDQKRAYAVLLFSQSDKMQLQKRVKTAYPPKEVISRVYVAVGNFLQLSVGSGGGRVFDFNLSLFCHNFKFNVLQAYNSLKILQRAGYLELTDEMEHASRIHFTMARDQLYQLQLSNRELDGFIKLLLRSYSGVFVDYVAVDEQMLASKAGVDVDQIKDYLIRLKTLGCIRYIPRKKTPFLVFTQERLPQSYIHLGKEVYGDRKTQYASKINAILYYASCEDRCRSQLLLEYFGEQKAEPCGLCDVCRDKVERAIMNKESIRHEVVARLKEQRCTLNELVGQSRYPEESVLDVVQEMLDEERISYSEDNKLIRVSEEK